MSDTDISQNLFLMHLFIKTLCFYKPIFMNYVFIAIKQMFLYNLPQICQINCTIISIKVNSITC